MLLAIDIGNSNIVLGIFKEHGLIKTLRFQTKSANYSNSLYSLRKIGIKNIIISSVVPHATKKIKKNIYELFSIKPLVLGEDITVPIKNLYKNPKEVGQDRLVNSFAASILYGYPSITIDFGTAITFDVVSKKGSYIGGLIFPGLELSLEALSLKAALLPKIKLQKPKGLIGKKTIESMRSGIYYGIGSLCDGIVEKINKSFGQKLKVIATGGHSEEIKNYCRSITKVDMDLTLRGIKLIFDKIHQNSLKNINFPHISSHNVLK